ncbi:MAG: lipoate--protein ligase family protein [Candidatus Aminicenantes bacterium]|nr:lipoate--protein ligase family protein [Candidatus Aminicenantes bacterium]
MKTWHLLIEPAPLTGSLNMAVDDFLFHSAVSTGRTFLRFYQWQRPTASLGATQNVAKVIDLDFCRNHGIDVVRRITGGKLVLHHREITYSICSSDEATFTPTLAGSYKLISRALLRGLEKMGIRPSSAEQAPPFYAKSDLPCFSHPARDEIEVDGKKIIGSAQKRTGSRFLQHGSIPLAHDEGLLKAVSLRGADPAEIRMTSLSEVLGRPVDFAWAVERLAVGFKEFFGVRFEPLAFGAEDLVRIRDIQRSKYDDEEWTLRGRTRVGAPTDLDS